MASWAWAGAPVSACDSDLAEVAQDAGVAEVPARSGSDRIRRRRLARLRQAPGQGLRAAVERAGQAIRDVVGEGGTRHEEAPRADRREGSVEPRVRAGGDAHRLENRVGRRAATDPVGVGCEKPRARGPLRDRAEPGPAETAAPERRHAPVEHHGGAVARAVEVDGLEVALLIEPEAVEDVAGENDEPRTPCAAGDGLAADVGDRAVRAVGADDETAQLAVQGSQ